MSFYTYFEPEIGSPDHLESPALWFAFKAASMWVMPHHDGYQIPEAADEAHLPLLALRKQYLGKLQGRHCFSIELQPDFEPPRGSALVPLRQTYGKLSEQNFAVAGFAYQIVEWDRTHQYCGSCGGQTQMVENDRARRCPRCGLTNYPRLSPAVIVLVRRGEQVLLSRAHQFPEGLYSVQAGFVEPGETLEEAVAREVREEVSIEIKNVAYFGSQPWPFPNSLMIAFTADYAAGEIEVDRSEVEVAGWYSVDTLPQIPARLSIARKLIDKFVDDAARSVSTESETE